MAKRKLSHEQLEIHLQEQLQLLQSSCDNFDNGVEAEAKRIALSVRILVHETKHSHSLLRQLNELPDLFISTAVPHDPGNIYTHGGLIMTDATVSPVKYVAPLDTPAYKRDLSFEEWWNEIVFVDLFKRTLTRKDLILTSSNQDGGAHVDPEIDDRFAAFVNDNAMGWKTLDAKQNQIPIQSAVHSSIRQIGHEVLKTLVPNYHKTNGPPGKWIGGIQLNFIPGRKKITPIVRGQKVGRNEPCVCGSGKKFKLCCLGK